MVGRHLVQAASLKPDYELLAVDVNTSQGIARLDLCNRSEVEGCVSEFKPDWVVCPAAMPNVERCELEPDLSYRINVEGTTNAIAAASRAKARFVFYSSAYVFDGEKGMYIESDSPNPLSVYAQHKLESEVRTLDACFENLVLRTDGVFGLEPEPKNYVLAVINRLKSGLEVKSPIDQAGNPTFAGWLASTTLDLLELGACGVYHTSGVASMWRYDFACLVAEVFGFDRSVVKGCRTTDLHQAAARPRHGTLNTSKLSLMLGEKVASLPSQLLRLKLDMSQEVLKY